MVAPSIDADRLRSVLRYEPESGTFIWLVRPNGRVAAGSIAGSPNAEGYIYIAIDGKDYRAARLAWFYMTNVWPSRMIDHKNLNKSDDRWDNLREAGRSENSANRPRSRKNTSGFKGVTKSRGRWAASIRVNDRLIWLGRYELPEEAHAAYMRAARDHFGEFARSE